jgi:CRP-like cAMP-binding protein
MSVAQFLKSVEAFRSLSEEDALRLGERVDTRTYAAGDTIIRRGDPGDCMFVISKGWVRVPILDEIGKQAYMAQLGERQFFGEMALLTGEPRNADVVAGSDCTCIVIPDKALKDLIAQYPKVAAFLTEILGERLMSVNGIRQVGKYKLIGALGRGGAAYVYEGVHPTLDRAVAVKMLSHTLVYSSHWAERFRNEAKIIASLRHPNIVEVYDAEEAYATFFIVMEKFTGADLGKRLIRKQMLSFDEVRDVICQVASALEYAHDSGVVHRDVKPSNIVINLDGTVKLTDFGIAFLPEFERQLQQDVTKALGTATYMSPEQVMAKKLDGRSDIYSLGIVAYELLTGRPPYESHSAREVLEMHVNQTVPSPRVLNPKVPEDLEEFVLKATQRSPRKRFDTCADVLAFFNRSGQSAFGYSLSVATVTFVYQPDKAARVERLIEEVRKKARGVRGLMVH